MFTEIVILTKLKLDVIKFNHSQFRISADERLSRKTTY